MDKLTERMTAYYTKKWAERYGVAEKDIDWALKMIGEVMMETDYCVDGIEATFLYLYHRDRGTKIPESPFEKAIKNMGKSSRGKGKLVKFSRY